MGCFFELDTVETLHIESTLQEEGYLVDNVLFGSGGDSNVGGNNLDRVNWLHRKPASQMGSVEFQNLMLGVSEGLKTEGVLVCYGRCRL